MLVCNTPISPSCASEIGGQASSPAVASSASQTSNGSSTFLLRQFCRARTAVGQQNDKSFGGQHLQGLAQRRAG
jgi:hypothetical protein